MSLRATAPTRLLSGADCAVRLFRALYSKTLAQDQATSMIYGMPSTAIGAGAIDEVAALGDIAAWLRYA